MNSDIKVTKSQWNKVDPDKMSKVVLTKNGAEITVLKNEPASIDCIRISSKQYLNQRTGEILNYSTNADRKMSVDSIRKTFKQLGQLVKANFSGGQSEVFLTLGYGYIMNDSAKLNHDFNLFWRKLKRRYTNCEYIAVAEYTGKQSLHLHIFLKSTDNQKLFFNRELILKLWGQCNVYIQRIAKMQDVESLIRYVNPIKNKSKFDRLSFYDRNSKIYRHSKGVTKPQVLKMTIAESMEYMAENNYVTYASKSYSITKNSKTPLNEVKKIYLTRRD